jgi:transcription termination/antitermination protein NusG
MMMVEQRVWSRGESVGRIDVEKLFGPREVPISPRFWFILRVHPGREMKVIKAFRRRNVSAWLPIMTHTENVRRWQAGKEVVVERETRSPMISGAVLIPDFEAVGGRWERVDGVIGVLRVGNCWPRLSPQDVLDLRHIEATGNTPKSKREYKFEIGELVRVTNGPFKSFGARVERFDSRHRLKIGVEIFGRITPIEVSETDIEKI